MPTRHVTSFLTIITHRFNSSHMAV